MNFPVPPTRDENSRKLNYPTGLGACINCGTKLTGRQQTFCGRKACRSEYARKYDWQTIRQEIIMRDFYTCQKCGRIIDKDHEREIDHVVPICLGGDYFDRNNLQLLCYDCHAEKTKKDMAELYRQKNGIISILKFTNEV